MTCKIDHDIPGTVPRELCRHCFPTLARSPAARAELDRADAAKHAIKEALRIRGREIVRLDNEIARMVRNGEPVGVPAKILAGLRKKRAKLEASH